MFDFDASKLVLIGIVALIFIGPKELPRVLRQLGQLVGKMRRMASEFQGQFMDAMKEADLENLRQDLAKVQDATKFNPITDIKNSISGAVNGPQTSPAAPEGDFHLPPAPEVPQPVIPAVASPDPPFAVATAPVAVVAPAQARKPRAKARLDEVEAPARKSPVARPRTRKVAATDHAAQDLKV